MFSHTISAHVQVNHITNADIDDSQEALILLLEFLLVKDLDRKDAVFRDSPSDMSDRAPVYQPEVTRMSKTSFQ
jgi:hypothetical protein